MEKIFYSIDVKIFYLINHSLANPLFDSFFKFITLPEHWIIAYVILLGILFARGGKLGRIAFLGIIIVIAVSDQTSSNLLKNMIQRVRPCNALPDCRLLVNCLGSYSFPSSHAVNNFAAAAYFSYIYPRYNKVFYVTAALVAFSRPYVGVHYPSDVIFGAVLGYLIGHLFSVLTIKIYRRFYYDEKEKVTSKT